MNTSKYVFFKDKDFTDFFKGHKFLRLFSSMELKKKKLFKGR